MAVERLSFGENAAEYDVFQSAQHAARYGLVESLCKGARVLDVSCGEGFGSYLIATWGASEVIAVDISRKAIEAAQAIFAHERIRYVLGDALDLESIIAPEREFDLIVCFETIEHLSDPKRFLGHLAKFRSPDGLIVISCPNDHVQAEKNQFHLGVYTLQSFRDLTTSMLGPAAQWLIGTPVLGQVNYVVGDPLVEAADSKPINIINLKSMPDTLMAPSQGTLRPSPADCTYYVGVWGAPLRPNAVISAQSHTSYVEPWLLKMRCAALQQELEGVSDRSSFLERELKRSRKNAIDRQQEMVIPGKEYGASAARHNEIHQMLRRRLIHHADERDRTLIALTEARRAVAELELEVSEWRRFQQSRSFRVIQRYYALYGVWIFRNLLLRCRRLVRYFRSLRRA
jgi:ubiquinone/menaquinone biosynthesis C-methylase UbiE